MGNQVIKTYTQNSTFTAPAGVTQVVIEVFKSAPSIVAGPNNVFFLSPTGRAFSMGGNVNGQLGIGNVTAQSSPTSVIGGLNFSKLADFYGSCLGLSTAGQLYAWGINANGQLGVGDVTPRSSPVAVLGTVKFLDIFAGYISSFGLSETGQLYAWGDNSSGALGVGDITPRSSPVAVVPALQIAQVSVSSDGTSSDNSVLLLDVSGTAYAMGKNHHGQLGIGDVTSRSSAVAVLGGLTFQKITVSSVISSFGLTTANALYAWGNNTDGQLGVGDVTPRSSPVAVLGGLTFAKIISAGSPIRTTYALTSSGVLYAWGNNANGQLGVGDVASRSSPVAVLGGLTFKDIFANVLSNSIYAFDVNGVLYAWGLNSAGQLGVGDVTPRSSPVAVLRSFNYALPVLPFWNSNSTKVSILAAALASGGGSTPQGRLYSWGDNTNGQLGVGDQTSRSSPVAILGGAAAIMNPLIQMTTIPVTPGTAYPIVINSGVPYFGTTVIGQGFVDSIKVKYFL